MRPTILSLVLLVASPALADDAKGPPEGFAALFDGKSLDGWKMVNTKDNFLVRDGVLVMNKGAGWLATEKTFGDFDLRIHYRFVTPGADSGVFIRSSLEGKNWTSRGYQVQNMDNDTLGMIVGMGVKVKSERNPEVVRKAKKPAGEWMDLRIRVEGKHGDTWLNGEHVATSDDLQLADGHIGLQAEGGVLEFERIDIKTLDGGKSETREASSGPESLAKGVRGLVTRAKGPVTIDGKLDEYAGAFCTPVHYNHRDLLNRAAQFFYMWDDQALYIGLNTLDQKQADPGGDTSLWNGDAVEFYLDTRQGDALRGKDWTAGAIHLFYTPFTGKDLKPRWAMRGGIATSNTALNGVEIAATNNASGYLVEFKIPWANFAGFSPKSGALLAIDAELCSGDGGPRTDRTFAYGSPLSVQQPASQGKLELVESLEPSYLAQVGPATFPMWVDTPWIQSERGQVQAVVAIPPTYAEKVGDVEVRIHDAEGKVVQTIPASTESFGPKDLPSSLRFTRAIARWSIDDAAPGAYFATARIRSKQGQTLASVAPRMVQEANISGR